MTFLAYLRVLPQESCCACFSFSIDRHHDFIVKHQTKLLLFINTSTCTLMSKFRPLLLFLQKYTNPTPANKFVKLIVKKSINSCGNVCLSMHTLRVSQIHRKQPPATHRLQEAYHQLLTTEATRSYISSVVRSDANFQYILQSIPSSTMWRLSDD